MNINEACLYCSETVKNNGFVAFNVLDNSIYVYLYEKRYVKQFKTLVKDIDFPGEVIVRHSGRPKTY